MDRDLRIFNRHFAHSTRSTLCTRYRLDNRTALSRHRHLHYGIRFRTYWITSRIAILRKEKRIGARLHFFFLHLLTDCDLRVDAKNDIFTWTFVKKKKIKERKKNSTNGRKNGLWSQARRTNKSILYGCNLDTLPLTKKASTTCTDNTSDNSWFMIRSYTPSNFRDTLNFYNVLKSITAFRDTSDHTRTIRTLLCR